MLCPSKWHGKGLRMMIGLLPSGRPGDSTRMWTAVLFLAAGMLLPSTARGDGSTEAIAPEPPAGSQATLPSATQPAAPPATQPSTELLSEADIAEFIAQLRSEDWRVRQAAQEALWAAGPIAVDPLREVAAGEDIEAAARAQMILDDLTRGTHVVIDGAGQPLSGARLHLMPTDVYGKDRLDIPPFHVTANPLGNISLPPDKTNNVYWRVEVWHPRGGRALLRRWTGSREARIRVPIVPEGSEAYERALRGTVVDANGEPLANAVVACFHVRTLDMGLIQAPNTQEVLTGKDGRFVLYVGGNDPRDERGELVPPNSSYSITVSVPGRIELFPHVGSYSNIEPARIVLRKPRRFHRLRFENADGSLIDPTEAAKAISVSWREKERAPSIGIGAERVLGGAWLPEGVYYARRAQTEYLPVTLTAQSPEEVVFRMPPGITYRGRVVDGITGEPLAGALVFASNAVSYNNLAAVTDAEWDAIEAMPADPPAGHPATRALERKYGDYFCVRTDAQGRYEIHGPPGKKYYGVIACARDRLPFHWRVVQATPDGNSCIEVRDHLLFPAAKVIVHPVDHGGRVSIGHRWVLDGKNQPEWVDKLRQAPADSQASFERLHWLAFKEPQPLYIPAGVIVRMVFDSPYHAQWATYRHPRSICLKPGETLDLGELKLTPALPVSVRVTGPDGKPIEGVPVRGMHDSGNAWSVAHNTDAEGIARFHCDPNSTGKFGVTPLLRKDAPEDQSKPVAPFRMTTTAPAEPYEIQLTAEQIRELFDKPNRGL